ncbi:MAG TPA: M13 family metallopeptidase [Candidatus Saccharimonadales bacterium]|nr:M13 family metallopeptidase [Candidatus Saccharimonadales bacterium]
MQLNLNQLDTSVRPQDDFFHYVNNAWLKENPIPASEVRWGIFDVLRDEAEKAMRHLFTSLENTPDIAKNSIEQQARDFYIAGMQYDTNGAKNLSVLKQLLASVNDIASPRDLSHFFGTMHAIDINVPWYMWIDSDHDDSSRHIFHLHQPSLTLPDRDYYLDDAEPMKKIRDAYKIFLKQVHQEFPDLAASSDDLWETIITFETNIAQKNRTSSALRDVEGNFNRVGYTDLQANYPYIDWAAYANGLGWLPQEDLSIDQPEVLAFINSLIDTVPLDTWKTYLKWRLITACMSKVNEKYAKLHFSFFGKVLSGATEMKPLWKRVVRAADACIGQATGQLYAERYFPESSKQTVLELVEEVRDAYSERIDALDWMSDSTKKYAKKKLENMKVLIGYPDKWRDFSELTVTPDSYLQNIIEASKFETQYWLKKLHQPTSREDWFMNPQTVNAYNDPTRLVICFPAAILQAPFFDPLAPIATNMAGIGSVIGHELTHGFDDQGYQFDANGNVKAWQTEEERDAFAKRAQVIIDQANNFQVLPDLNLKGELVIGESIADLGGIEIALHALKKSLGTDISSKPEGFSYSHLELFFFNCAFIECSNIRDEKLREYTLTDWHPASIFRVNGMLQHVDDFVEVFRVTEHDALYRSPDMRARIW